jgi:hypothetical protein
MWLHIPHVNRVSSKLLIQPMSVSSCYTHVNAIQLQPKMNFGRQILVKNENKV